jgi:phage major head subunit gpT-like protein
MDLTPEALRVLRTTFVKQFQDAYTETPIFWDKLATLVPSSSAQNDYGWMAALPSMREWIGPRQIDNLRAHHYAILNRLFEMTFGIKRDDMEDDNLGVYSMKAQMQGEAAAKHPDELIVELMQNGDSASVLAFDGQFFFDNDHPINPFDPNSATYDNLFGLTLDRTNFLAVRNAMMAFQNESFRSLGVTPDTLIVPPALEGPGMEIVEMERTNDTTGGGNNVTFKMAKLMVIHELAGDDTTWYLGDFSRRIKPFVYQLRRPLSIVSKDKNTDDIVLEHNELRFYTDIRDAAGVTLPFLMSKSIG